MPVITVSINGRGYQMSCGEGQESHLRGVAAQVNERATQLSSANPNIDEPRLLAMTAILLADDMQAQRAQLNDVTRRLEADQISGATTSLGTAAQDDDALADVLDGVSDRLEALVAQIDG